MISVKNLTKMYGDFTAVNNISFNVSKGEVLGFLGPNGAGKSTTIRVLTTYLGSNAGTITIDGIDVDKDPEKAKKIIGYLPESAPLYLDMDPYSYLKFIAEVREIDSSIIESKISEIAQTCGLTEMLRRPINELSKGYRQRVGLAQALIHDPKVLILDEPTSGLDPNQIIEIRELIKRIGKEKTVILSSHILSEVSATCSKVIIINEGNIVAEGTPDELTESFSNKKEVYFSIRADKDDVISEIPNISFVSNIEVLSEQDGILFLKAEPSGKEDINELIFKLCVEKKWILNELRSKDASLEDVFIKLTAGKGDVE